MTVVTAVIMAAALLTVTFSLLLTPWPTRLFAQLFSDESASGFTHEQMVDVASGILDYSLGNDDADIPRGDDDTIALNDEELAHLRDCRGLFNGVIHAAMVFGIATVVLVIVLAASGHRRVLGHSFRLAAILTLLLGIACIAWAIWDFNAFFNYLHHFFFASDSWYFPADSLMISALPTPFWIGMGVLWAVLVYLVAALYMKLGRHFIGPKRRKHGPIQAA